MAETNTAWLNRVWNSSNFRGRLSKAQGRRKPYSTRLSFLARSPLNMARTWGRVTWLSSTKRTKSSGK